jgi:hypothetical protein
VERKGHVQTVHVYVGIIIHTCQRGKEGSHADCARIFRDYYSHVPAWKGRVTCRHVYLGIIIHMCQRVKKGSRTDYALIYRVIIHTCQRGKEGLRAGCFFYFLLTSD